MPASRTPRAPEAPGGADLTHLSPAGLALRRKYFGDEFPRPPADELERTVVETDQFRTDGPFCSELSERGWVCSRMQHEQGDHIAVDASRVIDRWKELPRA
jgi:hypothetical protein